MTLARPGLPRALLGVCALALGVRLLVGATAGMFLDELYTWHLAAAPFRHVLGHGLLEPIPPGWYLLLGPLARYTADPLILRLPSLLAGVLAVAGVYLVGRRLAGNGAALLASALMAVAWPVWLADTQVRMYGFLILLNVVALAGWLSLREAPSRWRSALYWAACLALPLVHYLGMTTLAALALCPDRPRSRLLPPLVAGLALGAAWLAFAMSGPQQGPARPGLESWVPWAVCTLPAYLLGATAIPSWALFRGDAPLPGLGTEIVAGVVGLAGWVGIAAGTLTLGRRDRGAALALAALLLVPLAAVLLGAGLGLQHFQHRYFVPSAAPVFLALACALRGRRRVLLGGALVAVNLATALMFPVDRYFWNQDWKRVADFVRHQEGPRDVLVAHIPYALLGFNQYYAPGQFDLDFSRQGEIPRYRFSPGYSGVTQVGLWNTEALEGGLEGFLQGREVVLVFNQEDPAQAAALLGWFDRRYAVEATLAVTSFHDWGRIHVWKLRPRQAEPKPPAQ